jgi:uncharacterized delta-60 repeat protein
MGRFLFVLCASIFLFCFQGFAFGSVFIAGATDGDKDTSFLESVVGGTNSTHVYSITEQADGKILVGGAFTTFRGNALNRITRLTEAGDVDLSFNASGSGSGGNVRVITVRSSDEKIFIGGDFDNYNGVSRNRIALLHTDGSLDETFDPGFFNSGSRLYSLVLQDDGKILIGGTFTTIAGTTVNRIARLNTDGSLDTDFSTSTGSGANGDIQSLLLQPDGKILVAGNFTSFNGSSINRILRLNSDGTLDGSFSAGSGADNAINILALQEDGKILAGGDFTSFNEVALNRIVRLNANGSFDSDFSTDIGIGANAIINTLLVQGDGKIFVGGDFATFNGVTRNKIVRLASDGSIDTSFQMGSGGPSGVVNTLFLEDDGKIVIGGSFSNVNNVIMNGLARIGSDGILETTFNVSTGLNGIVRSVLLQSDEKVIVAGEFTSFGSIARNRIARLNRDGTLDEGFSVGTGTNNNVYSLALQDDDKILIGGNFSNYNGSSVNRIARLNTDGSLDSSFAVGSISSSFVYSIAIQDDDKILIGGTFTSIAGTTVNRIARLNANGSLDTDFAISTGSGANGDIRSLVIQSDGKILVAGNFTSFNGSSVNRILRLNTDGTLDTSFSAGSGANAVINTIAVQDDGKILVGGNFTSYNAVNINRIARLNTDGSLDEGFIVGMGANAPVWKIMLSPVEGKIICSGEFSSYNGISRNKIARITSNGTVDDYFLPLAGANISIFDAKIQPDGNILVGGNFTSYQGTPFAYAGRILSSEVISSVATSYTFTGPLSGFVGSPSNDFVISPVGGNFTGTITITPTGEGAEGLSPVVLTFNNSSESQIFTITPSHTGDIILTLDNNGGLPDSDPVNYEVLPLPENQSGFVRVFILLGQSNAFGTGGFVNHAPEEWRPLSGVLFDETAPNNPGSFSTDWEILGEASSQMGPEMSFAAMLKEAYPSQTTAVIKITLPATGIDYWRETDEEGYEALASRIDTIRERLNASVANGEIPGWEFSGALSVQGENESNNIESVANAYETNFSDLVSKYEYSQNLPISL